MNVLKKYSGVIRKTAIVLLLVFAACEIVYIRSVERDYSLAENEYTELANQYALITDSLEGAGSGDVINIGSDATPLGEAGDGMGDTDNIQSDEYL